MILYRMLFREDCIAYIWPFIDNFNVRFTLTVPSGVDYDLYVYNEFCQLLGSSTNSGSTTEKVVIDWNDTILLDNHFLRFWILYSSGSSCNNWHLNVHTWGSAANPTPPPEGDDKPDEELNETNNNIE